MKNKDNIKKEYILLLVGILLVLFGIYLSVFKEEPHFYTFFSIGILISLIIIYNFISKKKIFEKWITKRYFFFFGLLLVFCIVSDKIGIYLGYWTYNYSTLFDEILKYFFEWAVPLIYFMIALMIGLKIFEKKIPYNLAFILSLILFVIPLGLFTEFINHFSNSWIILSMPFSNFKIRGFFVIFQTIGYSLMAIITFIIYRISEKIK